MNLIIDNGSISFRSRFFYLFAALIVLCIFSFLNFTVFMDWGKALACVFLAIFVTIDLVYLFKTKKLLYNHILPLVGFFLLLILIPILGNNTEKGRMWIFLFPLFSFYTQGIKRSLFLIGALFFSSVIIFTLSSFSLISCRDPYTLEQFFVFFMISILSLLYERIIQKKKKDLNRQIFRDLLTGLSNRRQLIEDLKNIEDKSLILINLDDFKEVNSLFGSFIGDSVICYVGNLLQNKISAYAGTRLYRLHADEFAILLPCQEGSCSISLLDGLPHAITETFSVDQYDISITASIGVSINGDNPLEEADMALRKAKESKENTIYLIIH